MGEQDEGPGSPDDPPDTASSVVADLVRLLGAVLAGGFLLSAAALAVCRVTSATTGYGQSCAELVPHLERQHANSLQTLVTLLAGAGLRPMR